MYIENRKLKQARKTIDISIKDMAFLLDVDASNLSKFERGVSKPTRDILFGYHIITGVDFKVLQEPFYRNQLNKTASRITELIEALEEGFTTPKIQVRVEKLNDILMSITCLMDIEDEQDV